MLENVSVGNRLANGLSGLPDSSENEWKISSSSEAVKSYKLMEKVLKCAGRSEDCFKMRFLRLMLTAE